MPKGAALKATRPMIQSRLGEDQCQKEVAGAQEGYLGSMKRFRRVVVTI